MFYLSIQLLRTFFSWLLLPTKTTKDNFVNTQTSYGKRLTKIVRFPARRRSTGNQPHNIAWIGTDYTVGGSYPSRHEPTPLVKNHRRPFRLF